MGCPIVHFEIGCKDQKKTTGFYSKLLGWEFQEYGPAAMIEAQGGNGIGGHINCLGHEPHNYVTVYAQVDNLESYLQKANTLGGTTIVPPTEVPGMGSFAWIKDPEGNIFGLWKAL